jgi:DNA repair exonuclease SbcCD ATPase subunit
VHSEKGKRKGQKHRSGGKYLLEPSEATSSEEIVEKTLARLSNLGSQTFAFSPFSQYYDDWLLSLKSVLSEFEANPAVNVDEEFVKERSQVIADVELKLAARRQDETILEETARRLADQNNLLVQTDTEYTHETQKLAAQRNSEIKSLTSKVHELEEELEEANQMKASIFSPFARKAKSKKTAEVTQKLDAAKSELEKAAKAFEVEQEKLQDEYEKKKQTVIKQVRSLEKKVEGAETDDSTEDRRFTCEEIINAVKALLQRKPPPQ